MLILTRKLGERINIGDDIIVTLVEIKGAQVKLGIEAPRHIEIYREELFEKIKGVPFSSRKGERPHSNDNENK